MLAAMSELPPSEQISLKKMGANAMILSVLPHAGPGLASWNPSVLALIMQRLSFARSLWRVVQRSLGTQTRVWNANASSPATPSQVVALRG